ncbi:MAG TPA: substrate-binding domain-containing protein, partial [Parachlamydiaceae bacterium]|nr:substrate-binding domain-containing protein [Parachlamydiaceae bacterium]
CDESFKPVIDAQIQVYTADYPDANIIVHYKPEAECLRDFYTDSIRLVIATRGFTDGERVKILDSTGIGPDKFTVARDAIAVIVHPGAKDSFFTIQEIRDLVTGKHKKNLIPVFDGLSATSTVRFMLDSVLQGENLGPNVVAAQSSEAVIEYVSKVPNAVGFIGVSWVANKEDTTQRTFLKKIRIAHLESTDSSDAYVQPVQYLIYTNSYPLIRDLVYVVKENHQGLGKGFGNFLKSERGQLIFRRAYLQPVIRPFYIRNAELEEEY